jgi:hypothetical protein
MYELMASVWVLKLVRVELLKKKHVLQTQSTTMGCICAKRRRKVWAHDLCSPEARCVPMVEAKTPPRPPRISRPPPMTFAGR